MNTFFPTESPLHSLSDQEVDIIFGAGKERSCAAGEEIVAEGEAGDSMFFLIEGTVEARLLDGRKVRQYERGAYFGELSWINAGHRRSATIVATSDAKLQELDQESVKTLIETNAYALLALLRHTTNFLVEAERVLIDDLRKRNAELEDTIKKLAVTQNRLTQEEETARRDALTGLFNRRCLDSELPSFMERAKAIGANLALIAMDLDHFKPVNDTLGHAAGDEVLRGVGDALRANLRKTDLPCRTGGDEFVFLLADVGEAAAKKRAEDVREAIGTMPHPGNEDGIRCTATLGGTLLRAEDTPESFMHRADEALYEAKRGGRNRVGWD